MVEIARPKPIMDGGRRSPILTWALFGAMFAAGAAFLWAIYGVVVTTPAYPIAEQVQSIAIWVSVVLGLGLSGLAIYGRAKEGSRPASRIERESRWEQALWNLFSVFLGLMLVPLNLPAIMWLIDQQAWLKVLAVGPYSLIMLCGFIWGMQVVIRDR